jgi:transposase InsO family protein/transposase-like protein
MYSYEDRMRAVRLYIEFDHQMSRAIKKLGYPSRRALRDWYQEFLESGDLHTWYPKRSQYSDEDRRTAVEYFWSHGENISGTVSSLGYPSRDTLRMWIDELSPGMRKVPIQSGPSAALSDEKKRAAVVELCAREKSAAAVAEAIGVSRVSLYKWKNELLGTGRRRRVNDPKQGPSTDDRDDLEREVESLRKRIHRLQLEHDILKGANELLKKEEGINPQNLTSREKTLLVDALRATYKACELLEELQMPRSSYFYHRKRLEQPEKYRELRRTVTEIFHANKKCYGYRRVHCEVKRCGFSISEKVIRRVMAEEGLIVVSTRRRRYSSYNGEVSPAVENIVDRNFHADAPNEKWLTDITEFQIPAGKAYLSPIIDCFDGMVVTWTIGTSPDAELVNTMLDTAIAGLSADERPIIHSDRGSHYRWPGWIERMRTNHLTRSMSKKGCTPDNAACEGFFGRLKNEMFFHRDWRDVTMDEFFERLHEYIQWYNEKRIKLTLGGRSPLEYRKEVLEAA